jgi:hypothetical protein
LKHSAALGAPDSSLKNCTSPQFLVLTPSAPGGGTLPGLLRHFRRFDAFGGLVAHWRLFGTSGHVQRPQSGVLQVLAPEFVIFWKRRLARLLACPVELCRRPSHLLPAICSCRNHGVYGRWHGIAHGCVDVRHGWHPKCCVLLNRRTQSVFH